MLIKKTLVTRLDLADPSVLYKSDIDNHILQLLAARYEGKCYMSMLVVKIVRLLHRSVIHLADNRLDAAGYVNVQFEAEGVTFMQGELLVGASITTIYSNVVFAKHQYAEIKLKKDNSPVSSTLVVGQTIPLLVDKVMYPPNQTAISVVATPYIPKADENIYFKITRAVSSSELVKLKELHTKLEEELALHTKLESSNSYKYFKELMYPYKVNQRFASSSLAQKHKLKPIPINSHMATISNGYCVYPSEESKHSGVFYHTTEASVADLGGIINVPAYTMMAAFITEYLLYLQALRQLSIQYADTTSLKPILVYLKICKDSKV